MRKFKGNLGYAKVFTDWIDEMYSVGINYITKFRMLYVNIWNKRKEMLTELRRVRTKHGSVCVKFGEPAKVQTLH